MRGHRPGPGADPQRLVSLGDHEASLLIDKLSLNLRLARLAAGGDAEALAIVTACEEVLVEIRADLARLREG